MSTVTAPPPPASQAVPNTVAPGATLRLGRYIEHDTGAIREIIRVPAAGGSTLVVDRLAGTHCDPRLVAHLPVDEPYENALIVSSLYLADEKKGHCRRLSARDLKLIPNTGFAAATANEAASATAFLDAAGVLYRIRLIPSGSRCPELRWTRTQDPLSQERFDVVSLREVIAAVEDYEPARMLTTNTLASHHEKADLSTRRLRAELERLYVSPIVLNRRLREVLVGRVRRGETTMSQIATRCGRVKRNATSKISGDASWLARRVGLSTESGEIEPSTWIHSDVLALIARDGLGVAPHEVEL